MEITLFSKCVKDLISEHDRVDVPYLGTFTAEMMPASYSDRQATIHPPYRKMTFHKGDVPLDEGRLLLGKVMEEAGVTLEQAGVELGWCLSRLSSELEGSKICKLPGLGVMRANARNEFYFVPDDDLDIWPDGLGLEPVSIRISERTPVQEPAAAAEITSVQEPFFSSGTEVTEQPAKEQPAKEQSPRKRLHPLWLVLIIIGVLLLLFVAASYLFTEQMSPILDRLLYTREELELLRS